jgi:hypothetical protein
VAEKVSTICIEVDFLIGRLFLYELVALCRSPSSSVDSWRCDRMRHIMLDLAFFAIFLWAGNGETERSTIEHDDPLMISAGDLCGKFRSPRSRRL